MKAQIFRDDTSRDTEAGHGSEALRVVIAYNDLPAARRAMRMLADLDKGLGDDIEFQPSPWPFELIMDPGWREAALSDAIAADILILTTNAPGPLPLAVERWVEFVTSQKRGTDAAVVALFGSEENPEEIGSLRLAAIRTVAERTGLDFFAPAAHAELNERVRSIQQRAETVTPLLWEILRSAHPPPRWGINE
jgi:hypothetical protein